MNSIYVNLMTQHNQYGMSVEPTNLNKEKDTYVLKGPLHLLHNNLNPPLNIPKTPLWYTTQNANARVTPYYV